MPSLTIRPATREDLALLLRWDDAPHVRQSNGDDDWAWERELGLSVDWREQLIAEADGVPIGYVEIIDPARDVEQYWGDVPANLRAIDIWIGEPAYLGRGHGTAMMRLALSRCFDDPTVEAVLVDPMATNTRAHRFYQKLGFAPIGHRLFGADACVVHRLDRRTWAHRENEPVRSEK